MHLGLSNVNADKIESAQKMVRIETVQNRFNPMCQRDLHNGVFKACNEHEMTYIAYSPVGGGGRHASLAGHETLTQIAGEHEATSYEVSLSWALSKGENVLPMPGASKVSSILSSVKAAKLQLAPDELKSIDEISLKA